MKKTRALGFDLARAWAIFGMYVVNFKIVFGDWKDDSVGSKTLSLFSGNSSSLFVLLAGIGLSILTFRPEANTEEKSRLRRLVLRRSWFLFFLGLALFSWWPADILHFYGGYMHLAALLLFVPKKWLLWAAGGTIALFHGFFILFDYEKGWDFSTLAYADFWSIEGFLRNTFFNGWNPIFPWAAFFFIGMWLGRLDFSDEKRLRKILTVAVGLFVFVEILIAAAAKNVFGPSVSFFFTADYLPPFLPFLVATGSCSVALAVGFLWIGKRLDHSILAEKLAATGRMTMTHYLLHLTLGMFVFGVILGRNYGDQNPDGPFASPLEVFVFSIFWFAASVAFSHFWSKKFKFGPFEWLMRRVAG